MSWLYPGGLPVALSLVGYNALLTSLFIWLKKRDRIAGAYVFASFFTFVWAVGFSFMANNELPDSTACLWGRISQASFFIMPLVWTCFVFVYTGRLARRKAVLAACCVLTAVFLAMTPSPWFIVRFHPAAGLEHYPLPGPAFKALTVLFLDILIYSFLELRDAWKNERSLFRKEDYRLFFYTQLFGYGLCALALLPAFGIHLPQYQLLVLPLWQFFLAYGMARRHLMDYEELAKTIHRDKLAVMSTVAASMHHEMKNPLFVIHGSSEAFLHKLHSGGFRDREEALAKAEEVVSKNFQLVLRTMDIIQTFSRFAKTKPQSELRREAISVESVLREVMPLIRYQITKHKIDFREELEKDLPLFQADRRQIEEVFFNLIVNACNAVDENGGIRVRARREAGGTLVIEVVDNGTGIPHEQMRNLFDPFYTTREEGTGLGLYITKRLVEQNGGEISVRSEPGRGSTFMLRFPISGAGPVT